MKCENCRAFICTALEDIYYDGGRREYYGCEIFGEEFLGCTPAQLTETGCKLSKEKIEKRLDDLFNYRMHSIGKPKWLQNVQYQIMIWRKELQSCDYYDQEYIQDHQSLLVGDQLNIDSVMFEVVSIENNYYHLASKTGQTEFISFDEWKNIVSSGQLMSLDWLAE